jgi:hypothetical protein
MLRLVFGVVRLQLSFLPAAANPAAPVSVALHVARAPATETV